MRIKRLYGFDLVICMIEIPKISIGLFTSQGEEVAGSQKAPIPVQLSVEYIHLSGTFYVPDTMLNVFPYPHSNPVFIGEETTYGPKKLCNSPKIKIDM